MNRWMVSLLACAIALSGCADEASDPAPEPAADEPQDEAEPTPTPTATPTSKPSGGSGSDPEPEEPGPEQASNNAPAATLAIATLNPAGAQSNFTVNVTDGDGDVVTWTLDADGDGAIDAEGKGNATAVVFFEEAGTYTANLTATDGVDNATFSLEFTIEAAAEPEPAMEDRGAFLYDPSTGECHYKSYTAYGGTFYQFELWLFMEDNGVAGLQVGNTFPGPAGLGFESPDWEDCQNGDLVLF